MGVELFSCKRVWINLLVGGGEGGDGNRTLQVLAVILGTETLGN